MRNPVFTSLLAPHTKVTGEQLATEEGILALGENLRALNRRRFLSTLAAAGAIAAAGGALTGRQAEAQAAAAPPIADVLNFALNLEFLEAEFYAYGSTGKPYGTAGRVLNPPTVTLTGDQLAVATALAMDEKNHITVLQTALNMLGATPITEPTIDFSASGTMPAVTTNLAYFAAARQFTALGNSAYAGAAADLISNTAVLTTAAQILGAEAQHLGVVNYLCATLGITPATDKPIDAQDVPPNGTAAIFTVTAIPSPVTAMTPAALGIARTPAQVLGVVYGVSKPTTTTPAAGTVKGGFFPNGVNGNIKST